MPAGIYFNFGGIEFRGWPKHKEFLGLYFRVSAESFIPCAVMLSCFIFVDSKQPRNPQKFEPLEIKYQYGIWECLCHSV